MARPIPDAPPVMSAIRVVPSSSATSARRRRGGGHCLVAQLPTEDLAGDGLGDLLDDLDLPRILVGRHAFLAEGDELLRLDGRAGFEADERLHRLPAVGVRNADDAALPDRGVLVQHVLDLARTELA